jgi:phage repressor protein C with HTH and peptisase S24 domain
VELPDTFRWQPGLFIAQVCGDSMDKKIPDGAWCLFKANPSGTRQGKVVLACHHAIQDPDDGGRYTVKIYQRAIDKNERGSREIVLMPCSHNPAHAPIRFTEEDATDLSVLAEWLAVIG